MAKVVSGGRSGRSRVSPKEAVPAEDPIESLVTRLLLQLGETPERNGLLKTPQRVAKAMRFMTQAIVRTSIICSTEPCSPSSMTKW